MISARTKAALAAAKVRGKAQLGGFRGRACTPDDCANARRVRSSKAAGHARSLAPIIARLDPAGTLSLHALAARLTADGLPTPAGRAKWTAAGIGRDAEIDFYLEQYLISMGVTDDLSKRARASLKEV
jgi:hypothetical protein